MQANEIEATLPTSSSKKNKENVTARSNEKSVRSSQNLGMKTGNSGRHASN